MRLTFFFLLCTAAALSAQSVPKSLKVMLSDSLYKKTEAAAQFRLYTLAGNDTVFSETHSTVQPVFTETLSDKDGIEVRVETLRWNIPLPRIADDSIAIEFTIANDRSARQHKVYVLAQTPDKRSCTYSIPGDGLRSHFFTLRFPAGTPQEHIEQWCDSALVMDARLHPLDYAMDASVFVGTGKHFQPSGNFAIRSYKHADSDTLFSTWTYANGAQHIAMPFNPDWRYEVLYSGRAYAATAPSYKANEYCSLVFYIDTNSTVPSFSTMRYTSRGDAYYGFSQEPGKNIQRAYLCENSETDKEERVTFARRFVTPNLSRPAYFVQGVFSLVPFNQYAGIQLKVETGEAGILIIDNTYALRYQYGTEAGRELFSLDRSFTANFFMGPVRAGLGTTLTGGRGRFGWNVKPLLGLSNGGIDLLVGYDLYLVGGKKFTDVSRFNFTVAAGPFVTKRKRNRR